MFAEEVKVRHVIHFLGGSKPFLTQLQRNQVYNELAVEAIVRQRSLDGMSDPNQSRLALEDLTVLLVAFRSRCKYFVPPLSDVEARKWWGSAS